MNRRLKARNPRTGEFDFEFAAASPEEIQAVAARLRQSDSAWASLDVRLEALQEWKAALAAFRPAILDALTCDTGRHLLSAIEVDSIGPAIDRWRRLAPGLMQPQTGQSAAMPSIRFTSLLVPYPLVGVISPWNFPLTLSLIDAIPALVAGCRVIVKPSEVTPRFLSPLRQSIAAVPALAAAFEIVAGDGATGAALIETVDAICFTGSVRTGRRVAEAAARRFIPAFLELGGKDPAIVTETADVEQAAQTILRASVLNTGQACQSLERVYVHASVYDRFVARLVELSQAATLNYPDVHQGQIGPLIFDQQADIIAAQLADAIAKGARVLCGGAIETHGGGRWIRPTVVVDVNHSMTLLREETFGPVMPVMRYQTIDEAIALANDSDYGLSGAVFAGSLAEAEAIATCLEVGAVSLNDGALTGLMHEAEKNSCKMSGMGGSRMGAAGLLRFFRRKALLAQTGQPAWLETFDESQRR